MFMTLNSFQFSSGTCGFKKTKKPDLAIIYSNIPCTYAGVFTTNQIRAACVDENKALLKKKKKIRAIIVNSGNANACTGEKGVQSVKNTQKIAANLLKVKLDEVLIASTGAIGVQLDMQKMEAGIKSAVPRLNPENFKGAAKAILTTDRFVKSFSMGTKDFKIIGFTKGAGMIHPNMATMLCYLMTDLKMSQSLLQEAVNTAVNIESWKFKDDTPVSPPTNPTVNIGLKGSYSVRWDYDASTNSYKRVNGGLAHTDAEYNVQLSVKNVVVCFLNYSGLKQVTPGVFNRAVTTTGAGTARIFRDGTVIEGTWKKDSRGTRTKFFDATGVEVEFNRGQFWMEMIPSGTPA